MVVIHYKKNEMNQFRWETSIKTTVDDLIAGLVQGRLRLTAVNNLRIKIDKLAGSVIGLADHGPLRPEGLRGLTIEETLQPAMELLPKEELKWANPTPNENQRLCPDKTGYRVGVAPSEAVGSKMKAIAQQASEYVSKNQVRDRRNLEVKQLEEHVSLLRGAVMIAYPAYHGLPPWDAALLILEDKMNFIAQWPDCEWLEESEVTAWFSGRELYRGKTFAEQITGTPNDKSTMIVKLEKKGVGAPVKESPVDENLQKSMMAYYYKKQEEQKKLEADNDDVYLNSPWANPSNLKNHLVTGGKDIGWKFK